VPFVARAEDEFEVTRRPGGHRVRNLLPLGATITAQASDGEAATRQLAAQRAEGLQQPLRMPPGRSWPPLRPSAAMDSP
jgi:hypothetical protein